MDQYDCIAWWRLNNFVCAYVEEIGHKVNTHDSQQELYEFKYLLYHYSQGDMDKHSLITDRKLMTDQYNEITKIQLGLPMSFGGLLTEKLVGYYLQEYR